MLMEVDGRSHGRIKSWRKLTEGPADARKLDRRCRRHTKVDGSSEGSADAQKLMDSTSDTR